MNEFSEVLTQTYQKATNMRIPLAKPEFDEDEILALRACLNSGWVTQGPATKNFEHLIAQRHQVRHALATTSCTAALHLATMALGLKPGDEVLVPAFTWVTSAHSVEYVGAKPVFVDVDPRTFNIDPERLEAARTPRTKAIIAVHLFGLAAAMDEIKAFSSQHNIRIIEDAACAIGSLYKGVPVGGLGDIGCFSFHPRKVITTGEGGAVTTNDPEYARRVAYLRNHGATGLPPDDPKAEMPWTMALFDEVGYNLRLSDIQSAVGVAQFSKLSRLLEERRSRAGVYSRKLAGIDRIVLPTAGIGANDHTYQSYVIRIDGADRGARNEVMRHLAAKDISTRPGTHAVHRLGYYAKKYGLKPEAYPNATLCEDTSITLPIFPGMTDEQQDLIVDAVKAALRSIN